MGRLIALGLLMYTAAPAAPHKINFDREIRPIFSANCFACHGPDEKQRMMKLRLDTKDGLFEKRAGYSVIVPGSRSESRLFQRISAEKPAMRMPPKVSGKSLTPQQVELIGEWIDQGAPWTVHWSYVPPHRPPAPEVKNKKWPRNPIDNFILARLEREGLKPSPEGDRVTLLRRASFDLTGLPPTPAEIDSFLKDHSPDAYEKRVDQLLRSPHYGERMAMHWLDLARYADTHGYHIDSQRDMWPWRDWVISAFNRNMPYDQFAVWQLAGDLLPGATREQKVATGFNRNHMINFEGGAIPDEYQVEYVVDRVETTANVFMGMTLGCARCHDHKYDPITQKDFYRFFAFFNNIKEKGLDGKSGNAEPYLQLPSPVQEAQLEEIASGIKSKEAVLPEKEIDRLQAAWEKTSYATLPEPPRDGLIAHYEFDGSLLDISGHYRHGRAVRNEPGYSAGQVGKAAEFGSDAHVEMGDTGAFDRGDPFTIAAWIRPSGTKDMVQCTILEKADDSGRGYELLFDESVPIGDLKRGAYLIFRMVNHWPDDALQVRTKGRLVQAEWHHITVEYDGSGKASGIRLFLNGKPLPFTVKRDSLSGSIRTGSPFEIGRKDRGRPYKGRMDDLRLYSRLLTPVEIETLAVHQPVRALLFDANAKRSKEQKERLRDYFLTWDAPETYRKTYSELKTLREQRARLDKIVPTTMVMQELEKTRDTFVLGRGDYRNHLDKVTPDVPAALPPLSKELPRNRLGLAKWLTDPTHPLAARVAVNRFWQMYFGTGIVKTAEDFGSQGEAPVHPELLDWLATEFIRTGWDVRSMQRLIVTSSVYRQSSRVTPELIEKDPENRLLARGPRIRLPAEMVRDNALAVSGLLAGDVGGPSVLPYSPKGLWEDIAYGDVFSAQTYVQGHGKDLYRRSLYTFWKRTAPPATLVTFDAPDREKCTARRTITNTPLQALALMNDPTFVEASRALAQRAIHESGASPSGRVAYAFRLATDRKPTVKEARILTDLAREKIADYRRSPLAAEKLLSVGESKPDPKLDPAELAGWTAVASVILSLDETITKE